MKTKPSNVTIVAICPGSGDITQIYGLGSDQKLYYWSRKDEAWILSSSKES